MGGGVQVSLTKQALTTFFFFFFFFFLSSAYFTVDKMVNCKEIYHFQGSRGGPTFSEGVQRFSGGSNVFQGGPIAYSL